MDKEAPRGLFDTLLQYTENIENWLKGSREHPSAPAVYRLFVELRSFVGLRDYYEDGFLTYVEVAGEDLVLRIYCLDPCAVVRERLKLAAASVFFSATLTPLDYFAELLGGTDNTVQIALPSPFPRENLCVAAVDSVSTRFEDREKSCRRIVSCIAATVSAKVGNYIVYFPSYAYLNSVFEAFTKKYPHVSVFAQHPGMTHSDREAFLDFFSEDDSRIRVGFCVLGGSFSEGVDLPGKRLIGVVVVGVGIPGLSNERNILRDHYQLKNENGYDFAYTYPGMNHVLQAAGRVIRQASDRGVVVLIDDRYATPLYGHLFPEHWSDMKFAGNATSLAEILSDFWEKGWF